MTAGVPKDLEKYAAWKKKLSEKAKLRGNNGNTMKGHKHSRATKDKIAKSVSEREISTETRSRMSEARINVWNNLSDEERNKRIQIWQQTNLEGFKRWFANLTQEERLERLKPWINSPSFNDTEPEKKFEEKLKETGETYEKQKWIGKYRVDFYLPRLNLIIEIQGCFWHGCEICGFNEDWHLERRLYDQTRSKELISLNYKIKEIWEHSIV